MFELQFATPHEWAETVLKDFDHFLIDHAAAEKKASGMAMSMALHYKDKADLVTAMIDLAIEELAHFREVIKIMQNRNLLMLPDERDPYVNGLRQHVRKTRDESCIDRLVVGSIIEARGAERFGLIAEALPPGKLKTFYQTITRSEDKHQDLFINLGYQYFQQSLIDQRLKELLDIEAALVEQLPHRPALH